MHFDGKTPGNDFQTDHVNSFVTYTNLPNGGHTTVYLPNGRAVLHATSRLIVYYNIHIHCL